jgi:hypothetical protein
MDLEQVVPGLVAAHRALLGSGFKELSRVVARQAHGRTEVTCVVEADASQDVRQALVEVEREIFGEVLPGQPIDVVLQDTPLHNVDPKAIVLYARAAMADSVFSTTQQELKWQNLYRELSRTLAQEGKESPYGEGDYWLLDDNYGIPSHKLYVFNLAWLTPRVVSLIQSTLRTHPCWNVVIALDAVSPSGEKLPNEGLVVFADRLERHWDTDHLRSMLGNGFGW